jgi:hypothetical protein
MLDPQAPFGPLPLSVVDYTLWFANYLTPNFESRYLSPESEGPLIQALILALYAI